MTLYRRGFSQESLKGIACTAMLVDHIGTLFFTSLELRMIGRIAFPIYCFLLVEGMHHTRDMKKYGVRLAVVAVLAEIPYDLAFSGRPDMSTTSVMVTLLLGYGTILVIRKLTGICRFAAVIPFFLASEVLRSDYAGTGIAIIVLFELTRQMPHSRLIQLLGLTLLCWFGALVRIGPLNVPIQMFAVLAMIPIALYNGRKMTGSKAVQWGFYLFYPAHLLLLWLASKC